MKKLLAIFACLALFFISVNLVSTTTFGKEPQYPSPNLPYEANPIATYEGEPSDDLNDIMVPIPEKDRVFNKTGIQCVWCSLETCGRYAEEKKLIDLTEHQDCKSYSSPSIAAAKLKKIKVRFEQTTSKSDRSLLIKSVVKDRRGCLFAVPGHAMTLVHYDEKKGIVKYINNSDPELKIRTWSMEEFNRRWDGWICTVYADNDIVPYKNKIFSDLPIVDRNGPQGIYSRDYILRPK